ncbi:MAG: glutamyl-tRNA reductase [Thermoleophilia bacterium]|nr:glutamyl-tRNA reductase [Thermoleophilia bacterium]
MHVAMVGLSHKTAPVEQREKASLSDREARTLLRELVAFDDIAEAVALSTCNRTELYLASDDPQTAQDLVVETLLRHSRISREELSCARYQERDDRAAAQLFRVASGLDSMVVGESEIQGQVRAAWERAMEEHAAGPVMNHLFRQAVQVGKQVRTQTAISRGPSSVPAVAVGIASNAFTALGERRVLVIGAGQMAEAVLGSLVEHGVGEVRVVNRTVGTARMLAARVGGTGVGFDHLQEELSGADIVISSTDAPHTIMDRAIVESALADQHGRRMVIVDISVPRDVDADVAAIPGVELRDIDDLEREVETNLNGRRREAQVGERLVQDAVDGFADWRAGIAATPAIRALRDWAEDVRVKELERASAGLASLSEQDLERVEILTRSLVNKLLHEPTVRARAAVGQSDGMRHVESLRHLFGLEGAVHRPERSN